MLDPNVLSPWGGIVLAVVLGVFCYKLGMWIFKDREDGDGS